MSNEIVFNELSEEGRVITTRIIKNSDIRRCPKVILVASHYRDDGSCRCDEIICEEYDCPNPKYGEEIYCRTHLETLYGVDVDELS